MEIMEFDLLSVLVEGLAQASQTNPTEGVFHRSHHGQGLRFAIEVELLS